MDGITICGNFAEVWDQKPEDFDYQTDAKWLDDYWFDVRECIGGTICSCKKIEVHYAMWHGYTTFHTKGCNLMRKLRDNPHQLGILWAYDHLPSIQFSNKAVPADTPVPVYVKATSPTYRIRVRANNVNGNQLCLI